MAKRESIQECSAFQRIPMTTTVYMTNVEVWHGVDGAAYIYAEPDASIKQLLP